MGTPIEHRAPQPPRIIGPELSHTQPNGYISHSNGVVRGQFREQGPQHHHNLHDPLQPMQQSVKAQAALDRPSIGSQRSNGMDRTVASHVPGQPLYETPLHGAAAVLARARAAAQAMPHCSSVWNEAGLQHNCHVNSMPIASVRATATPPPSQRPNLQPHQPHVLLSSAQPAPVASPAQPTATTQQRICTPPAAPRHSPLSMPQQILSLIHISEPTRPY